jgi:hypothetical protein
MVGLGSSGKLDFFEGNFRRKSLKIQGFPLGTYKISILSPLQKLSEK